MLHAQKCREEERSNFFLRVFFILFFYLIAAKTRCIRWCGVKPHVLLRYKIGLGAKSIIESLVLLWSSFKRVPLKVRADFTALRRKAARAPSIENWEQNQLSEILQKAGRTKFVKNKICPHRESHQPQNRLTLWCGVKPHVLPRYKIGLGAKSLSKILQKAGRTKFVKNKICPHRELNPGLKVRNLVFYPLNHGGENK